MNCREGSGSNLLFVFQQVGRQPTFLMLKESGSAANTFETYLPLQKYILRSLKSQPSKMGARGCNQAAPAPRAAAADPPGTGGKASVGEQLLPLKSLRSAQQMASKRPTKIKQNKSPHRGPCA